MLDWRAVIVPFSWSAVKFGLYFVHLFLGEVFKVGSFRVVLPNKPVEVLVARARQDRAYGENVIDTLDFFDSLPDGEKGDLTSDQLDTYKRHSYQVTDALINVLSPLPATVLPQ